MAWVSRAVLLLLHRVQARARSQQLFTVNLALETIRRSESSMEGAAVGQASVSVPVVDSADTVVEVGEAAVILSADGKCLGWPRSDWCVAWASSVVAQCVAAALSGVYCDPVTLHAAMCCRRA